MRDYRFQADEDSVEVFRRLRGAWRDVVVADRCVIVRLADDTAVRLDVVMQDIEPGFAAACLIGNAVETTEAEALLEQPGGRVVDAADLGLGGNDVVLFTGATWLVATPVEPPAPASGQPAGAAPSLEAVVQQLGTPADIPTGAEAVCLTHDALVVASPVGTGCLVRIASAAGRLELISDRAVVAAFLTMRSYASDDDVA